MKVILFAAILALSVQSSALAAGWVDGGDVFDLPPFPYVSVEKPITVEYVSPTTLTLPTENPPPVVVIQYRRSFAMKHPKLHKIGRKIRRTCSVLLPIVEFAGACGQVVTAVR